MRIVTFRTPQEKIQGLQHLRWIDDQTLFVFPQVYEGDVFHSQNVSEPFDIAFVSADGEVLLVQLMYPPDDLARAPEGSVMAVESKGGRMADWGIVPGGTFALV